MPVITFDQDRITVSGTAGDDTISGSGSFVRIDGDTGNDVVGPTGAQNTIHGGLGDDSLIASTVGFTYGDAGADTITGLPNETVNRIEGGLGDDVLIGSPEQVFLAYAMYSTADSGVRVSLATEAAQAVGGGQGVDSLRNFNALIGSDHGDTLTAGAGSHKLYGGAGADRLEGGSSTEMFGGLGDDTLVGGSDGDFAGYFADPVFGRDAAQGGLTVDLRIVGPQDVGGGLGRDALISIENLGGGRFGDTLTGSAVGNIVFGREGDDLIRGLEGDDVLFGDDGSDTVEAGSGNDRVEDFGGGLDNLHGNQGDDTVGGGDGADTLRGGQGGDVVQGGAGGDFLAGDRGSDTLTGGDGADIFHAWAGAGGDRVTDFSAAQGDRVLLLPGAAPTVSQAGTDIVIDFGAGERMVLVGVTLAGLPPGWIFGA